MQLANFTIPPSDRKTHFLITSVLRGLIIQVVSTRHNKQMFYIMKFLLNHLIIIIILKYSFNEYICIHIVISILNLIVLLRNTHPLAKHAQYILNDKKTSFIKTMPLSTTIICEVHFIHYTGCISNYPRL